MAWQGYVDSIVSQGKAVKAGVFALDGSTWAATPGWSITKAEISHLVGCAKNSGPQRDACYANGVKIAGIKFKTVRFEDDEVWKGAAKEPEEQAACAYVCNQCVLIAIAPGGHSAAGDLNVAVQRNHSYLKEHGY